MTWRGRWVILLGLLVLSYNLRPTATQIGPVLPNLQRDLSMGPVTSGILTSLPTACFAVFGIVTPWLATRWGIHRTLLAGVVALCVGAIGRTFAQDAGTFLALSTLALAGLAVGNILAPSIVRHHFPEKVGLVTALYSLVMSIGVSAASALTVPMTTMLGGWRAAYLSSTSVAVLALIPWIWIVVKSPEFRPHATGRRHISLGAVARTPLGLAMVVFFGLQSAQAYSVFGWLPTIYMASGMSQGDAGWMLGIATGAGIPLAFLFPAWVGRHPRPIGLQVAVCLCGALGYLGLMLWPTLVPWVWALLIAIGTASFPIVLAMFGLKARSSAGTTALSALGQGGGYVIALFGPLLMGILHARTGSWTVPLLFLTAVNLVMGVAGIFAMTRPLIEDELALP